MKGRVYDFFDSFSLSLEEVGLRGCWGRLWRCWLGNEEILVLRSLMATQSGGGRGSIAIDWL